MSVKARTAFNEVKKSIFTFIDDKGKLTLEIKNAHIFWTNFRGERNSFGNDARYFNVALSPDIATQLQNDGWRIREYFLDNEEGEAPDVLFFVQIKVNMDSEWPPIITLMTEFKGGRHKRELDISTIGELDRIDIKDADCLINIYESPKFPGKLTGYLKKLYVLQDPDIEFGGKWDDWLEDDMDCLAKGTCTLDEYNAMIERKRLRGEIE